MIQGIFSKAKEKLYLQRKLFFLKRKLKQLMPPRIYNRIYFEHQPNSNIIYMITPPDIEFAIGYVGLHDIPGYIIEGLIRDE